MMQHTHKNNKAVQRTAISPTVVFLEHFVHYHWSRMGKKGNTSCLIGNLNILGYVNML